MQHVQVDVLKPEVFQLLPDLLLHPLVASKTLIRQLGCDEELLTGDESGVDGPVYGPSNENLIAVSLGSVNMAVTSLNGVIYSLISSI